MHPTWDEDAGWFCLSRGPVTVAVNLAAHPQSVPVPAGVTGILLASDPDATLDGDAVRLVPDSVAIVHQNVSVSARNPPGGG